MWPDRAILADQIIIMTPGFDLLQNSDLQRSPVIDNQFRVMYLARGKPIGEELTYIEPRAPDKEKSKLLDNVRSGLLSPMATYPYRHQ